MTNTCQPCNSGSGPYYACQTCSGGFFYECTSCNSGTFLLTSNICILCDSTCATCSAGGNNNCLSCNSGTFLYILQCIIPCPAGYWGNTTTNTCQPCYSSGSGPYYTCPTCSGGNYYGCTSWNSGTFLYPNTGGECLNPGPNGFWGQTTLNTCQPCNINGSGPYYTCRTCSAGGNNNCLSCNSGTFLYLSQYIILCPAGYWGNTTTNTCQPCYSSSIGPYYSCSTCSRGRANNDCDSCNSGSFLYSSQFLSACPDGYWSDYTTNSCQLCSSDTVNISSCPTKIQSNTVSALQISAKSSSTVLVATSAALQNSNSASSTLNVNLFLYLAVIEAIANM